MLEDYYEIIHMKCLELCVTHFAINIYQVSAATINYAQDLASLHANPDSANQNLVKWLNLSMTWYYHLQNGGSNCKDLKQ